MNNFTQQVHADINTMYPSDPENFIAESTADRILNSDEVFIYNDLEKYPNELPNPSNINDHSNPYYIIKTKYGYTMAMFVIDDDNETLNWMSDYANVVITPVLGWISTNDTKTK